MIWKHLVNRVKQLINAEEGVTAAEYAVCLALIVLVSVVAVAALGVTVSELFPDLADYVKM